MAIKYFCVLAMFCISLSAGASEAHCPAQVQLGSNQYSNILCQAKLEQNADHNGQSILLNLSIISPTPQDSQVKKEIPQGYVHLEGPGYYKYHTELKNFNEARKICKGEGGHLAIFNSEAEAKFVASLPENKYDWAYIGIHDLFEEGQWVTILDEELHSTGYTTWAPGEPNLGTTENCGVVFPNGLLGDFQCDLRRSFFCEIN